MTDARYPERWLSDRRLMRLKDRDYRVYVTALVWSVSNRTDGILERDDLDLIPGARNAVEALVTAELWTMKNGRFVIIDYAATQTSSHELEVLENVRRNNREAQARAREKKRSEHREPDSQPDVSMTGEPDDIGKARPGRQGQEDLPAHARENENEPALQPLSVPAPATGDTRCVDECGWCHGPAGGCDCIGSQESPSISRRSA